MDKKLKILIKYPSRSRPERFFDGLKSIYSNLYDTENFHVSATLDEDDLTMNNGEVIQRISSFKYCSIELGVSKSKIDAVNRTMPNVEWDILVVMSDDMRFTFFGFDEIIRQQFEDGNLDKLIHIPDQDTKDVLATMYIAGRTFYERFGWIYPPMFKSLWCDNAIMKMAKILKCYFFVNCPGVVSHLLPAMGHLPRDEMFDRQQNDWDEDYKTFLEYEARNFDLNL